VIVAALVVLQRTFPDTETFRLDIWFYAGTQTNSATGTRLTIDATQKESVSQIIKQILPFLAQLSAIDLSEKLSFSSISIYWQEDAFIKSTTYPILLPPTQKKFVQFNLTNVNLVND
jgi:hypothetical protein